ncbi:MAG: hypothetical protein AAGH79_15375 [Bacteroidota bacterium]
MRTQGFTLLAIFLFLGACSSTEQYRESIEATTQAWNEQQINLKAFQDRLDQSMKDWKASYASAQVSPLDLEGLSEGTLVKLDSLGKACKSFGPKLTSLEERLQIFLASEWLENQKYLDQLNEGLQSGKLMGDAASQLSIIETVLTSAKDSMGDWDQQLQRLSAQSTEACAAFGQVVQ